MVEGGAGPFRWVAAESRAALLGVLTVLLAALSVALTGIGAPLVTEAAPGGIVSFEFAGSAEQAGRIVASWPPEARERATLSLGLDYLYLLVYPAWFSLACALTARRGAGALAAAGLALSWLVLAAGPLDAVENAALLRLMGAAPSDAAARLAWLCAGPKFALVLAASLYLLAAQAALALRRLRS
jgi:hypothetical protein